LFKRIAGVVMAGAMCGKLLVTGSASATKAAVQATMAIRPSPVLVSNRPVTVTIKVVSDGVDVALAVARTDNAQVTKATTVVRRGHTWIFKTAFAPADLGSWNIDATATGADQSKALVTGQVLVQVPTRIVGFNAHPRVVSKSHPFTLSGRLQAKINHRWQGLAGKVVEVVFVTRAGESSSLTLTTDEHGRFSALAAAEENNRIHVVFDGDDTHAKATSNTVFVRVIKSRHSQP
jgi:hypothetical protein